MCQKLAKVHKISRIFHFDRHFLLNVKTKIVILNVDLNLLHAHHLKWNVNPLTPSQLTFCLAEINIHDLYNLKDPCACLELLLKCFISIES